MAKEKLISIYQGWFKGDDNIKMTVKSDSGEIAYPDVPEIIRKAIQKWLKSEIKEYKEQIKRVEKAKKGEFESEEEESSFNMLGKSEIESNYNHSVEQKKSYETLWKKFEKERLKEKIRQL